MPSSRPVATENRLRWGKSNQLRMPVLYPCKVLAIVRRTRIPDARARAQLDQISRDESLPGCHTSDTCDTSPVLPSRNETFRLFVNSPDVRSQKRYRTIQFSRGYFAVPDKSDLDTAHQTDVATLCKPYSTLKPTLPHSRERGHSPLTNPSANEAFLRGD